MALVLESRSIESVKRSSLVTLDEDNKIAYIWPSDERLIKIFPKLNLKNLLDNYGWTLKSKEEYPSLLKSLLK